MTETQQRWHLQSSDRSVQKRRDGWKRKLERSREGEENREEKGNRGRMEGVGCFGAQHTVRVRLGWERLTAGTPAEGSAAFSAQLQ